MSAELRVRFLRDILRSVEREHGPETLQRVRARLPERLHVHLEPERLRSSTPSETMSLDDAEEVILAIDSGLGDGTGRVLESASADLVGRTLASGGLLVLGDLAATVARMQAPLEWPFVGAAMTFDLEPTDTGFSLTLGVSGRPRTARVLRHVATGAIRAAQRYCREANGEELELLTGVFGDRANVTTSYRSPRPSDAPDPNDVRLKATRRLGRKTTQPRLAEEVERILSSPPAAPSHHPPDAANALIERSRTAPGAGSSRPPERSTSSLPPERSSSSLPPERSSSSLPPERSSSSKPPKPRDD
ncbi:MAG: hypothetical protein OZ921_05165 [Sorangiineae bacterium]|nr:hypothetical protein [Polyangiaceae bacterium]MEB2321882.1 hypothetical protein [Sorangiineae bacterium]